MISPSSQQKVDFTFDIKDEDTARDCLGRVGRGILKHGKTQDLFFF